MLYHWLNLVVRSRYFCQELVDLLVKVGGFIVEDAEIGKTAFLFLVHLLCHACLDLLEGGMVSPCGSLKPQREWGIDFDREINSVLEARFKEEGALLGDDGGILLRSPPKEVLLDDGVNDGVHLGGVVFVSKEVGGYERLVEFIADVRVATEEFNKLLADVGTLGHETLGFVVAMIDGDAALSEQLADVGLAAADASCDAKFLHVCWSVRVATVVTLRFVR